MQRLSLEPFLERLGEVLPAGWSVALSGAETPTRDPGVDAALEIRAPDGSEAALLVEIKTRLSARQAAVVASSLSQTLTADRWAGAILLTRFASRMARERLESAGISYLDLTGNARIRIDRPAVFIQREGAETDPDPPRRGLRSLKGTKAARIVRVLCDRRPPVGVRETARRAGADPGYVTRVLSLLEDEDVVLRDGGGRVVEVRWRDLLRRWSRDYSVTRTNRAVQYLAPRGLSQLRDRLSSFDDRYAVTGMFAVPPEARVVPGRLLRCYVGSAEIAARKLDLRPSDTAANVVMLEAFDEIVFKGTRMLEGLTSVALTQCVVDLLTGSGREPAQAEALMSWMADNEDVWRD